MKYPLPVGCLAVWLLSALCHAVEPPREAVYRVNSFRVPCVGVGPMQCLQIRREGGESTEWPAEQVPADASSIRYELIEILEQEPDPRFAVHDIWMLERIDGTSLDSFDTSFLERQPYIELNVSRGDYLGHEGCNDFRGDLAAIGPQQLRLGQAIRSEPARSCGDESLPARFLAALERVTRWERSGLWLVLLDSDGSEILAFHKTD